MKRSHFRVTALRATLLLLPFALGGCSLFSSGLGPTGRPRVRYDMVENWITAPEDISGVSAVTVDSAGNVLAFRRDAGNVWVIDTAGVLKKEWGQDIAVWTHGIRVDPEGFIWTIDGQGHTVKKWTPDATELVMTLGKLNVAGEGPDTFNRPTDVAFAPNGDFFISDGYENTRVVKFARNGRFLKSWGDPGTGPSQFNTVHSVVIDRRNRVLVADRDNARVQIFDLDGNFLGQWTHLGSPYSLWLTDDDLIYISDGVNSKIWVAEASDGRFVSAIEDTPGVHWAAVDQAGNVYAASNRMQYLRKYAVRR
jgi:DNA-binding beta-propeller fold protein YncE